MTTIGAQYWNGKAWVREMRETVPPMTAAELPAYMTARGIPDNAELTAGIQYDEQGPEVWLVWYEKTQEEPS